MRAKSKFHCSLVSSFPNSLDNVREALWFYREIFEAAAASGTLLRLELTSHDEKVLQAFYSHENLLVPGRLYMLLNDAFDDTKLPYAAWNILRAVGAPRFYCKIIRFNWHKMKRVESK